MIVSHVEGPTGAVPGDPGNQSVAELIKQVSEEPSRLLRSELRLAQAEMTPEGQDCRGGHRGLRGGRRAGLVRTGLPPGHRYLGVGSGAAGLAGRVIVAVVVAIAAGIAALVAKKKVAEAAPPVPTDTVESVKKDVEEIKESARR
jgi:hypothetical protein